MAGQGRVQQVALGNRGLGCKTRLLQGQMLGERASRGTGMVMCISMPRGGRSCSLE